MFKIFFNNRARYLATIRDEIQKIGCKHVICNFKGAFLVIKASKGFIGKSILCDMTQIMADHISDYDGNTFLIGSDDNEYIFISGFEIIKFSTRDKILDFISLTGNHMILTAIAIE